MMMVSTTEQDLQLAVTLVHMRHASQCSPISSIPQQPTSYSQPTTPVSQSSSHQHQSQPSSPTRVNNSIKVFPITSFIDSSTSSSNLFSFQTTVPNSIVKPYTREQRQLAVRRYLDKKHRRQNATDKIRYQVRKNIAHARPRFRGRFSKRSLNLP